MKSESFLALGEVMAGLFPRGGALIEQTKHVDLSPACSELNTLVILARLGARTSFITKLPDTALGQSLVSKIHEHGIDTSHMVWSSTERVGVMLAQNHGMSPHQLENIYDRGHTAMATLAASEVRWRDALRDVSIFHTTGVTLGVGYSVQKAVLEGFRAARAMGITVSFDVNYRSSQWRPQTASKAIKALMPYIDVLFVTDSDAQTILGAAGHSSIAIGKDLCRRFDLPVVVISRRRSVGTSMIKGSRSGLAITKEQIVEDQWHDLEVVGRLGSGDAFAGGFLYGYATAGLKMAVRYGNAASALKQSNPGPLGWISVEEIEQETRGGLFPLHDLPFGNCGTRK